MSKWATRAGGHWWSLFDPGLDNMEPQLNCGYIIWHAGNPGRVVRVGQTADLVSRLREHRGERAITRYSMNGELMVTWTRVAPAAMDGVERYLGDTLMPLVGSRFPDARPIRVGLPW